MCIMIVVKVYPSPLGAAPSDPMHPRRQLIHGIIVSIPPLRPVHPQIDIVRGPDKFVREARSTGGAEDRASLAERIVNRFIPPTGVTELDDVTPSWIELAENRSEPRLGILITGWKLEKEAAHALAKDIGDHAKIC